MKPLVQPLPTSRRLTWLVGAIALVSCALLGVTARAHASETIYWDNYAATPSTIGFANIDGTGGGILNTSAITIEEPEGLAYDPSNGRIYIADSGGNQIQWAAVDGSGSGVLDTAGAIVEDPRGVAVDPSTQTVYWVNAEEAGSIGFASANGGGGGVLNTTGASVEGPHKLALDTVNGRVYWATGKGEIDFANLNNTGGGQITYGAGEGPEAWQAINVDPAAGRLYFLGESPTGVNGIYWFDTSGVGGGEVPLSAVSGETPNAFNDPYGLSFDPSKGRFIWANYGSINDAANAFGTATLGLAASSSIPVATAPVNGPQDPVVVKSPTGAGAPQVTGSGTALSCSRGSWSQDYPGSYVYGAPVSYSYQWSLNGQPISGANGTTFTATSSGSYTCMVTGTNRSGSASQTSAGYTVTIAPPPPPASFSLTSASKKKVKVKAGKTAVLKLDLKNAGGTTSSSSKVCVQLSKKAKKGLVAPKCAAVGAITPGAITHVTLKVKTKSTAKGTYKFSVVASGASGSAILAERITVMPAKKKHGKKHHHKK